MGLLLLLGLATFSELGTAADTARAAVACSDLTKRIVGSSME